MRRISLTKRICSAVLAVTLILGVPSNALAETVAEIQAQQSALEQEQAELQSTLDALRDDLEQKEAYQQALEGKIAVLQKQIDTARENINTLNASITELTAKIDKAQQDIQETMDTFKERLRALYTAGDVSTLQMLLDSSSLSEFAMRTQAVQSISDRDEELMNKIQAYLDDTKDERTQCEEQRAEVARLQKSLESNQEELNAAYEENAAAMEQVEGARGATEAALANNEAELAANEQKMADAIAAAKAAEEEARRQQAANNAGTSGSSGGDTYYPSGGGGVEGFNPIWPLPGVTYVSCYYGGYAGHRGMDIAGPYGTPVVAAESGTVIEGNSYDSWGDSWGYYVLVYHNGTYTTRYAHLSSLAVSTGDYVTQGQVVGYEGATGNVTGPHLHFEVYENGVRVDPMNFL